MGIEKMKYVNFVGGEEYLDEFINKYMTGEYALQPEYAMSVLKNVSGLYAYKGTNPCTELLRRSKNIMETLHVDPKISELEEGDLFLSYEDISARLSDIEEHSEEFRKQRQEIEDFIRERRHVVGQLSKIKDIDVELSKLFHLRFFKIRFGKMPKSTYDRMMSYLDTLDVIMFHVSSDENYEYVLYLMPTAYEIRVDGLFNSLQFERIWIPDTAIDGEDSHGTPAEVCSKLTSEINEKLAELDVLNKNIAAYSARCGQEAVRLHQVIEKRNEVFEIRKYVAFNRESFYLVGWMPEEELNRLQLLIDKDPNVITIVDDIDKLPETTKPPTKLKNNFLFRPFEPIVTMYGLPSYNEIDPTPLIAIIYCLMTGFMFGDVGQGLVFAIAGAIMLRKKSALAGVFFGGGICAMIFGFLYGSIFSMEDVIKPLFMNPMESANINTMLIIGIALGVVLLIIGMIFNILNGIKSKDKGRIFFDRNGIAGMVFYLLIIGSAVGFLLKGKLWISAGLLVVMILIPFVIIFFKHPLENILNKKKAMPKDKGSFFIETAFEIVDMLLSFASNTISFVRLSAFAINHVGLSMAFIILSNLTGGAGKVIIMIIGNVLIIGLEGLIVGIQGLRLVYYELFSRFYSGDGVPYTPLITKNKI